MTASFARFATVTASTKRNPAAVGGKVGAAVAHLTGLAVLPVLPAGKGIVERYLLKSPRKSYVTYTQGTPDVLEGDTLTAGGVEYKVIASEVWQDSQDFLEIVLEKVVGA
jgi:hypothetical protein